MNGNLFIVDCLSKVVVLYVNVLRTRSDFGGCCHDKRTRVVFEDLAMNLWWCMGHVEAGWWSSLMSRMSGITSRKDCKREMYSASVELKAISVWRREFQTTGQPA
jgi:hypothetical protein